MKAVKIKEGVYWVGGIDWNLRNFHGYLTQRGSTYNAYLIVDEKVTLVDTVKHYLYDEMIERISSIIDPSEIDYIVSNHVEMDHSGGLPKLMEVTGATLFTSPKGKEGLEFHYDSSDWDMKVVKPGAPLELGKRTLNFILTPMVHWPDNMVVYMPEEKILFSNDSFGQHYATSERFDDEVLLDIALEEAKKYFANIVMGYRGQVKRELDAIENHGLELDIIAPSHGIVWRKYTDKIIAAYRKWAGNKTDNKAVVVYDTMWGSTEEIAYRIVEMFEGLGVETALRNLKKKSHFRCNN